MKLWFDGGCRPNPGTITTAVVTAGRSYIRTDHGEGDNNDAEWLALIDALTIARDVSTRDIIVIGDAALVVEQATGRARRMAPRFRAHVEAFATLAAGFDRVAVRHVRRGQNLAGIALERLRNGL